MKLDFGAFEGAAATRGSSQPFIAHVSGETDPLTDVLLCAPHHLAPVPCCAVTRHSIESGFETSAGQAIRQHRALIAALERHGIACHHLPASPNQPDMCFTRDVGVATPWGMVALNPAMPHRRGEVDALLTAFARMNIPARRIDAGTLEGGDICVARDGLLLLGLSGERSSPAGIAQFAEPFRAAGWDVLICPFHADHLHLDTIFCMVDRDQAIGCIELLDPAFVRAVNDRGIAILPVPAASSATLGCNILALGDRCILASSGDPFVGRALREASYRVETVDISQFAACGGGIHCLTQPLRRVQAR
jgi:arginine deiminase